MPISNTTNQVTPMLLERARSFALRMSFLLADDSVVDLTGGVITFRMLEPVRQGTDPVLTKNATLVSPELGYAVLDLQAAELDLAPGTYPYSITYVDADLYSSTIVKGEVQILSNTDPLTANVYDVSALDIELGFSNIVVTVNHLQPPEITVGAVVTLPYGTPAGASFRGGYPHHILDLSIPAGAPGGSQEAYDEAFGAAVAAAAADATAKDLVVSANAAADATAKANQAEANATLDLAAHEADTSVHGVATVAGLTEAQAFQNKDLSHASNVFPASLATDAELSAAIAAIPPQDTVYLTDKNLISNPGFEVLDGGGLPAPWYTFWAIGAPVRSIETVLANVYEGAKCAKVVLDTGEYQRYGSNVFALGPGELITVRCRVKATGSLFGSFNFVCSGPADPDPDYFGSGSQFLPDVGWSVALADGWVQRECTFIMPAGKTKARVFFTIGNDSGATHTAWLDKTQALPEPNPSNVAADVRTFMARMQTLLGGGGLRRCWENAGVSGDIWWDTNAFQIQGLGRGTSTTQKGWQWLRFPAAGTVIPGYGGADPQTVQAANVAHENHPWLPMATGTVLYYDFVLGNNLADSDDSRWKLVGETADFVVPANWIAVCTYDSVFTECFLWGDGHSETGWITATMTGAWTAYGGGFAVPAYMRKDGIVRLKGLMKTGNNAQSMFTLPVGFRPFEYNLFPGTGSAKRTGAASAGTAHTHDNAEIAGRINVYPDGTVTPTQVIGVGTWWISVSGICFPAEQ